MLKLRDLYASHKICRYGNFGSENKAEKKKKKKEREKKTGNSKLSHLPPELGEVEEGLKRSEGRAHLGITKPQNGGARRGGLSDCYLFTQGKISARNF